MSTLDRRALNWIVGPDTGTSSTTIWAVMMGATYPRQSRPSDASDFGRCYRLLEAIPEWRARLPEVAEAHPEWAPLVAVWAELEDIWRAVGCTGPFDGQWNTAASRRLYGHLKSLDRACLIAGGWVEAGPGQWRRGDATVTTLRPGLTMTVRA